MKLLQYCLVIFVRPTTALRTLLTDRRRHAFGILGQAALALIYFVAITVGLATKVAHLPEFLLLSIPAEHYYAYERFFVLPVAVTGTMLASGTVRLLARLWNGEGRFEDLFSLIGFAHLVLAVVIGLPDLVIAILVWTGHMSPLGFKQVGPHIWIGTLWYLMLIALAIKQVEQLRWPQTVLLALTGFAADGMVSFLFIR